MGACEDDVAGNSNQGSAYVFVRSGVVWTEEQKLTAADGGSTNSFGSHVSLDEKARGGGAPGQGGYDVRGRAVGEALAGTDPGARHDPDEVVNIFELSHHGPLEEDRCVVVSRRGIRYYVCARCLGVYIGIVAGACLWLTTAPNLPALLLLPLPAFIDWTLYMRNVWKGINTVRILTGGLLGAAYAAYVIAPFTGTGVGEWAASAVFYIVWCATVLVAGRLAVRRRFGW